MFSLRFTIVLLIILGISFLIRYKYKEKYEPFPAILLPSGASKAPLLSDEYHVSYTDLIAQKVDGSWANVDSRRLLYPLPYTNHKHVFERAFGLIDDHLLTDNHNLLARLAILKARISTEREKNKTKKWLEKRLIYQGFAGNVLGIVKRERVISISTGKIINENIIDEKILYLD